MVPVEITAFGLLAVCAILLAIVSAVQLLSQPTPPATRGILLLLVLIAVVVLAIYVWVTTRMP